MSERSPLCRLLRGGRLHSTPSAAELVASSELPPELRAIVLQVVRRTGGWRFEQADVAQELIAHFEDALRQPMTPTEAAARFGDVATAAKLLRRAMHRKRGLAWRAPSFALRAVVIAIACIAVAYGALAVHFYGRSPNIATDYLAQIRALASTSQPVDPAWPRYRAALPALRGAEATHFRGDERLSHLDPLDATDAGPGWDAAEAALRDVDAELRVLRSAAALPSLGVVLGQFDDADRASIGTTTAQGDGLQQAVDWIPLPHLGELRRAAQWLACDARHAAARGDGATAAKDVEAILGIAGQTRGEFVVEQLHSLALLALGSSLVLDILDRWGSALDADASARIASALDAAVDRDLRIRFAADRLAFLDTQQRIYSDDGAGDGRLLHTALPLAATRWSGNASGSLGGIEQLAAPALAITAPGRREAREKFERSVDAVERISARPVWTWTKEDVESLGPRTQKLTDSGTSPLQLVDDLWSFQWGSSALVVPAVRQHLDIARLAVAAHRYRLGRGAWPDGAQALVPAYLPTPAIDMYDGKPLRFSIRDGAPVIWSIGPDRHDDGMSPLLDQASESVRWVPPFEQVDRNGAQLPHGDIRLWPRLKDSAGTDRSPDRQ
ncbi:MAG: hypothetical protein U0572_06445 [Phycisphaerales bacterium]